MGAAVVAISLQDEEYEAHAAIAVFPQSELGDNLPSADTLSLLVGTLAARVESRDGRVLDQRVPGSLQASTEGGRSIVRLLGTASTPEAAAETVRVGIAKFQDFPEVDTFVGSQVIDQVDVPQESSSPSEALKLGIALIIALGATILAALAADRFRQRIVSAEDLSAIADAPFLGALPRARSVARGPKLAPIEDRRALPYLEAIRAIRTNLRAFAQADAVVRSGGHPRQQILVTSATEGQGKSTFVANLAVAFAQVGIDVLVVDADLRHPQQHEIFDLGNDHGLTTLDDDNGNRAAELDAMPTHIDLLRVLPAGPTPRGAADVLHVRFPSLIAAARNTARVVLVDSPPLVSVSDARIIAPHVTGVLLIAAPGKEQPDEVAAAVSQLRLVGANLIGTVLNGSSARFEHRHPDVSQRTPLEASPV